MFKFEDIVDKYNLPDHLDRQKYWIFKYDILKIGKRKSLFNEWIGAITIYELNKGTKKIDAWATTLTSAKSKPKQTQKAKPFLPIHSTFWSFWSTWSMLFNTV